VPDHHLMRADLLQVLEATVEAGKRLREQRRATGAGHPVRCGKALRQRRAVEPGKPVGQMLQAHRQQVDGENAIVPERRRRAARPAQAGKHRRRRIRHRGESRAGKTRPPRRPVRGDDRHRRGDATHRLAKLYRLEGLWRGIGWLTGSGHALGSVVGLVLVRS
jgi:hypothetical protein